MPREHVQTKHEIAELLGSLGLKPRKSLGQHFLIDGNLMRRLVESAQLQPDDIALEVGAGTGGLTDLLVNRAGRIIAAEIDRNLASHLKKRFSAVNSFTLIEGDVLEGKHVLNRRFAEAIRDVQPARGLSVLVSNLPYNVATPLLMNILIDFPQVRRLCFTVQAETAERILAAPGCKAYGPISIITQLLCDVHSRRRVPPSAFWPRPAVESMMMRLDLKTAPPLAGATLKAFAELVRGVFDHRRKALRGALALAVEGRMPVLPSWCDGERRPEAIGPEEWIEIFRECNYDWTSMQKRNAPAQSP